MHVPRAALFMDSGPDAQVVERHRLVVSTQRCGESSPDPGERFAAAPSVVDEIAEREQAVSLCVVVERIECVPSLPT